MRRKMVFHQMRERVLPSDHDDATSEPCDAAVWSRIVQRLRAELGEDVFNSWFARLELTAVKGNVAHLTVPTKRCRTRCTSHVGHRRGAGHMNRHRPPWAGAARWAQPLRAWDRTSSTSAPPPGNKGFDGAHAVGDTVQLKHAHVVHV